MRNKIRVLIFALFFIFMAGISLAEDNIFCSPLYFDSILVEDDEIIIQDQRENGFLNKFILQKKGQKHSFQYDKEGKELSRHKGNDVILYAGVSEQIGEQLELINWEGREASFKLIRTCVEPACVPRETKECAMKVKYYWGKQEK